MTAVMRREFGTTEPPSSEVELGLGLGRGGRANGLVHVHFLPPVGRSLLAFCMFLFQSQFDQKLRKLK